MYNELKWRNNNRMYNELKYGKTCIAEDGRLLPKHVEARIYDKAMVKICALCWLFLLRLIMHGTNIKLVVLYFCFPSGPSLQVIG
jgi:hypothetical protein